MQMNLSGLPVIPEEKVIEIIKTFRLYRTVKKVEELTGIKASSIQNILADARKKGIALPKSIHTGRGSRRDWNSIITKLSQAGE